MSVPKTQPFPWKSLEATPRADVLALRELRRWIAQRVRLDAFALALTGLIGADVRVLVGRAARVAARAGGLALEGLEGGIGVVLAPADDDAVAAAALLEVEPALALAVVARILRRPPPGAVNLSSPTLGGDRGGLRGRDRRGRTAGPPGESSPARRVRRGSLDPRGRLRPRRVGCPGPGAHGSRRRRGVRLAPRLPSLGCAGGAAPGVDGAEPLRAGRAPALPSDRGVRDPRPRGGYRRATRRRRLAARDLAARGRKRRGRRARSSGRRDAARPGDPGGARRGRRGCAHASSMEVASCYPARSMRWDWRWRRRT